MRALTPARRSRRRRGRRGVSGAERALARGVPSTAVRFLRRALAEPPGDRASVLARIAFAETADLAARDGPRETRSATRRRDRGPGHGARHQSAPGGPNWRQRRASPTWPRA